MTSGSITVDGAAPEWTLGDRLRKARMHAGMQQRQLAAAIGIAQVTVNKYEHDTGQPRRPVLVSWAMATGVALDWLLGDAEVADRATASASSGGDRHFLSKMITRSEEANLRTSFSAWSVPSSRNAPVAA